MTRGDLVGIGQSGDHKLLDKAAKTDGAKTDGGKPAMPDKPDADHDEKDQ